MIKANELRKRNLIHYKGKVESVVGIDQDDYIIIDNDYYDDGIEHVKEGDGDPIPLSPEWLERCGFETREEPDEGLIYSVLKMDLDIIKSNDGYYLYTNNTDPWHNRKVGRKIEFVHQLQNIHLDLTGEELNVKL